MLYLYSEFHHILYIFPVNMACHMADFDRSDSVSTFSSIVLEST